MTLEQLLSTAGESRAAYEKTRRKKTHLICLRPTHYFASQFEFTSVTSEPVCEGVIKLSSIATYEPIETREAVYKGV